MIPKIKAELFNNNLYTVSKVNDHIISISYLDYLYSQPTTTHTTTFNYQSNVLDLFKAIHLKPILSGMASVGLNVYNKTIHLNKLDIPIDRGIDINNISNTYNIFNTIRNEINKEFIKKVTKLGQAHRKSESFSDRLDIIVSDIKKKNENEIGRKIISKLISNSSFIAVEGRIGPSHWYICNSKTYSYIIKYIGNSVNLVYNKDNQIMIDSTPFIINNLVEDGIIITGRKNNLDQTGVHCLILTDSDGYIDFFETASPNFGRLNQLIMHCAIIDIGLQPETQYLNIKTRSIGYYRSEKLKKIKELYE